jgi:hypothetical protein
MMLLPSAFQKLTAPFSSTAAALAMKLPPGIHDRSGSRTVEESPLPMRNDQ